jgi:hypothetical protein
LVVIGPSFDGLVVGGPTGAARTNPHGESYRREDPIDGKVVELLRDAVSTLPDHMLRWFPPQVHRERDVELAISVVHHIIWPG